MIGVFAAYRDAQTAHMALSLLNTANRLGYTTSWFSPTRPVAGISALDRKIKSDDNTIFYDWAKNCAHIAWFTAPIGRLSIAKALGCKNTLVANAEDADYSIRRKLDLFDCVLAPSVSYCKVLAEVWNADIHPLPWDTGNNLHVRKRQQKHVAVPVSKSAINSIGLPILRAIGCLLEESSSAICTIVSNCRWPGYAVDFLHKLHDKFLDRIAVSGESLYAFDINNYDWLFYPNVLDDVCLPAVRAAFANLPVIGFSTDVFRESIMHGINGYAIDCECVYSKWAGLRLNIVAKESVIADSLVSAVCNSRLNAAVCTQDRTFLKTRRDTFQSVWDTIWQEPAKLGRV